jgi:hypothetical protein
MANDKDPKEQVCGKQALTLLYWPGRDPLPVCPEHHAQMVAVGGALGLYVATSEAPSGSVCSQRVS